MPNAIDTRRVEADYPLCRALRRLLSLVLLVLQNKDARVLEPAARTDCVPIVS